MRDPKLCSHKRHLSTITQSDAVSNRHTSISAQISTAMTYLSFTFRDDFVCSKRNRLIALKITITSRYLDPKNPLNDIQVALYEVNQVHVNIYCIYQISCYNRYLIIGVSPLPSPLF